MADTSLAPLFDKFSDICPNNRILWNKGLITLKSVDFLQKVLYVKISNIFCRRFTHPILACHLIQPSSCVSNTYEILIP